MEREHGSIQRQRSRRKHPVRVLMIDHDAVDPREVEDLLARATTAEYVVHLQHSLEEGLEELKAVETACVLLDLSLPGAGLEAVLEVRKLAPDAAIVVLTDPEEEGLALEALKAGAQDYLVRGTVDDRTVARAVRYSLERKRGERDLVRRASYDPLTNLPNRSLFLDRLGMALARLSRTKSAQVSVVFIDIDNFKALNDSFGHEGGDRVLIEVARRLRDALRPEDTIARFGGDEFVVLCEAGDGSEEPEHVATRLRDALGHPVLLPAGEAVLHASLGISVTTDARSRPELLLREADLAMYQAKQRGGGRYEIFDDLARERDRDRLTIERGLQRALDRGELRLHYQPIVSVEDRVPIGVKTLLRWEHPTRGLVPPQEFVELAEETGLIVPIGGWVLQEACTQAARWSALHRGEQPFVISINLSPMQLMRSEFPESLQAALELTGDPPATLWLEVTETVVMEHIASTITTLEALKGLGAKIVLDDFGTGYASLQSLRRFPIDGVKIDRTFVAGLARNRSDVAIVSGIAGIAAGLDLQVVAEGVETDEQMQVLRDLECPLVQGMHLSAPLVPEEVPELLARGAL